MKKKEKKSDKDYRVKLIYNFKKCVIRYNLNSYIYSRF